MSNGYIESNLRGYQVFEAGIPLQSYRAGARLVVRVKLTTPMTSLGPPATIPALLIHILPHFIRLLSKPYYLKVNLAGDLALLFGR